MDDAQAVALIAAIRLESHRVQGILAQIRNELFRAANPDAGSFPEEDAMTFTEAIADARELLRSVRRAG